MGERGTQQYIGSKRTASITGLDERQSITKLSGGHDSHRFRQDCILITLSGVEVKAGAHQDIDAGTWPPLDHNPGERHHLSLLKQTPTSIWCS